MRIDRTGGILAAGCALMLLAGCGEISTSAATAIPAAVTGASGGPSIEPPSTSESSGATLEPTGTPRPTPGAQDWMDYPVVPSFSGRAAEILRRGIALGRNVHAFSKIGDCQNITTYFLADFENPEKYRLGEYADLAVTIEWFEGYFGRKSVAVKGGLNVASVMNPLMADPDSCPSGESPLACELRVNNPGLALISFEEAWDGDVEKYETYLRRVIEYAIDQGVVPIVATKADNLEGGNRINTLIARLAWEYDIPLWNFWSAVQPLRYHGLAKDGFHLTQADGFKNFYFDLPPEKWRGWMARNLSALQSLDAARKDLIAPAVN